MVVEEAATEVETLAFPSSARLLNFFLKPHPLCVLIGSVSPRPKQQVLCSSCCSFVRTVLYQKCTSSFAVIDPSTSSGDNLVLGGENVRRDLLLSRYYQWQLQYLSS